MRLEQMLNSTGSSLVADFDSQINRQLGVKSTAESNKNAQVQASKNWGKAAWEDSESKWRKGNFTKYYSQCIAVSGTPCLNDNQTGRKNRYRDRHAKAQKFYNQSLASQQTITSASNLISDLRKQKADYLKALNEGASKGQTPEQINTIYQQDLQNAQAQGALLEAQTKKAEGGNMTLYYVIGGLVVLGIVGFFIARRKK